MSLNPCCVAEERRDIDGDDRWMSIHKRFLQEAQEKGDTAEVLFLGDDIFVELQLREIYKLFEELHILNFSIRGDKIENLLWRVSSGELDRIKPKIIVTAVGNNNIPNSSAEEIVEGMSELVKEIRKRHDGFIVFLTLLPRGQKPNELREKSEKVNLIMKEKFKSGVQKLQVIDIANGLIQSDGTISHHDMYDYFNLTNATTKKIFEPVLDLLNQILNEEEEPELLTPSE